MDDDSNSSSSSSSPNPPPKTSQEIEAELRAYFGSEFYRKDFTFEGMIGSGSYGFTFRLVEKFSPTKSRRLAMKVAQPGKEGELKNEIRFLTVGTEGL